MSLFNYYLLRLWEILVGHGLPLLALLLLAILVPRIGRLVVRVIESRLDEEEEATKARLAIAGALVYVFEAIAYFLIIIAALSNLGVPPLGAAIPATIVSAAVGFGAQSIIADFMAGFFVLSEKQYGVGDYVSFDALNGVEGTVVALTLRTTKVRTPSGEVVTIPNGSAGVVTNFSQDWSRAVVNFAVPVQRGENLPDITSRVESISREAIEDPTIASDVNGTVEVLPATDIVAPTAAGHPWQVTFRILVDVNPARQWAVERSIRSALLAEFWSHYNVGALLPEPDDAAETEVIERDVEPEEVTEDALADTPENDGPAPTTEIPLVDEDEYEEPRNGIWRDEDPKTRWGKVMSFGGRVRASTTGLILAFLVTGGLVLASSNPDDANAGWLNPAYWTDRDNDEEVATSEEPAADDATPTEEDSTYYEEEPTDAEAPTNDVPADTGTSDSTYEEVPTTAPTETEQPTTDAPTAVEEAPTS